MDEQASRYTDVAAAGEMERIFAGIVIFVGGMALATWLKPRLLGRSHRRSTGFRTFTSDSPYKEGSE